jgi:hypothetical protein
MILFFFPFFIFLSAMFVILRQKTWKYTSKFVRSLCSLYILQGAYIANRLDPEAKGLRSRGKEAAFLQTRVTRNGGAAWEAIRPPSSFRFGQCNACAPGAPIEQCSLHLHGPTSWFAPEGKLTERPLWWWRHVQHNHSRIQHLKSILKHNRRGNPLYLFA